MFSKACGYAIRASIFIARQSSSHGKAGLKEIAKAIDTPAAFTAKILQKLTRNNILSSDKGPGGGFYFNAEQLEKGYLAHIVEAIDGDDIYKGCALGLRSCNDSKPCPLHFQFKTVREKLKQTLETTTIGDLVAGIEVGDTYLKR
jgi:Rrf2 family protein